MDVRTVSVLFVLLASAQAAFAAGGKPVMVKGHVLDSAGAFTKDLKSRVFQRGGPSALVIDEIKTLSPSK